MSKRHIHTTETKKAFNHNFKGTLTLVIPCYNESNRIEHLFNTLKVFDDQWRNPLQIVLVDDGSSDDTVKKIEACSKGLFKGNTTFDFLRLGQNQGKGAALKAGVEKSSGDYVLTIDADMAAEPTELEHWLASLPGKTFSENEILIGSREHEKSKVKGEVIRRIAGLTYNFIIQLFTNLHLSDTQCGFKLYPKAIAKNLFKQLKTNGWAHDIELLNQAKFEGVNIRPMPVKWIHQEDSKISLFSDSIKMLFSTIGIAWRQNWNWFILQPVRDLKNRTVGNSEPSWYRFLFLAAMAILLFGMLYLNIDSGITDTDSSSISGAYGLFENKYFLNALLCFLAFLFTGLLAKEIGNSWRIAFLSIILSVLFMNTIGSKIFNSTVIPFAAAYVFTLLHLTRFVKHFPRPGSKTILMTVIGIFATIYAIRISLKNQPETSLGMIGLVLFPILIILAAWSCNQIIKKLSFRMKR